MSTTPTKAIFYDTETTGLFRQKLELTDSFQPHLVQLSALLMDLPTQRVTQSMNLVVQPQGWSIPEEAQKVHGISTAEALEVGMPERIVLEVFLNLWNNHLRVGHNEPFDANIISVSIARHFGQDHPLLQAWQAGQGECTMRQAKPIVQAKNAKGHLKWPKLTEAYEFFFHEPLDKAHTANADVVATMEIWHAMQQNGEDK